MFLLPVLVDLYSSQGEYKVFEVNPKSFPDKVDPTQAYTGNFELAYTNFSEIKPLMIVIHTKIYRYLHCFSGNFYRNHLWLNIII